MLTTHEKSWHHDEDLAPDTRSEAFSLNPFAGSQNIKPALHPAKSDPVNPYTTSTTSYLP